MSETMETISYADWFVAAKKAVDAIFNEQTDEDVKEIFRLSKEVYNEGSETVSSMAAKIEAIGKVLIAMVQRINGGSRDFDETPFGRVVSRALKEFDARNEIPFE